MSNDVMTQVVPESTNPTIHFSHHRCYVGQEVITRTFTSLVIRRRLIIVEMQHPTPLGTHLTLATDFGQRTKHSLGQVLARRGRYLLCLVNLRDFTEWMDYSNVMIDSLKFSTVRRTSCLHMTSRFVVVEFAPVHRVYQTDASLRQINRGQRGYY